MKEITSHRTAAISRHGLNSPNSMIKGTRGDEAIILVMVSESYAYPCKRMLAISLSTMTNESATIATNAETNDKRLMKGDIGQDDLLTIKPNTDKTINSHPVDQS